LFSFVDCVVRNQITNAETSFNDKHQTQNDKLQTTNAKPIKP